MKKVLVLLIFLFSSCASSVEIRVQKQYETVNEEFKPYVEDFISMSRGVVTSKDFKHFTMGFRDYPKDVETVGTCHPQILEVDISREWWENNQDQIKRLELVFHEFGHCILNRGHTKKTYGGGFIRWLERIGFLLGIFTEKGHLSSGCPASIMHPRVIDEYCLYVHYDYYIKELFGHDKDRTYIMRSPNSVSENNKCRPPKVINNTDSWDKRDKETLRRAKKTCIDRYKSCLKAFWKKDELAYLALCE